MVLRMARPLKQASGVFYVRGRIPRDVLSKARGRTITLPEEAGGSAIRVTRTAEHVKASLRTKDSRIAKERHSAALAYLERLWQALRTGPRPLTQKQIVALAGSVYRWFARGEDEPGPAAWYERLLRMLHAIAEGKHGLAELMIDPTAEAARRSALKFNLGPVADALLSRKNLVTDEESRWRLIQELHRTIIQAAEKLKRNAEGDYSPDLNATRFPEWSPSTEQPSGKIRIPDLFEGWARESRAANLTEKTISEYRSVITRFTAFLGHDDASRVSAHDVVAWKDKRLSDGRSPKTVKDVDLSALKSVFGWAARNHRLPSNPAKDITVKLGRKTRERPAGFTDEEALAILGAALSYVAAPRENQKTAAAKRWLPWLAAYTGARIGELAQLRRKDLHHRADHWSITITPEAGTVKNKQAREVPLHPHLVELGFPKFAQKSVDGYLFLNATSAADVHGVLQALKNREREFVRTIVSDKRVAPNHGWRHRFVSDARRFRIDQEKRRMILGQTGEGVDERVYGDPVGLYFEIQKLPRYKIEAKPIVDAA